MRAKQRIDGIRALLGPDFKYKLELFSTAPSIQRWTWQCGCEVTWDGFDCEGSEYPVDWERCALHAKPLQTEDASLAVSAALASLRTS